MNRNNLTLPPPNDAHLRCEMLMAVQLGEGAGALSTQYGPGISVENDLCYTLLKGISRCLFLQLQFRLRSKNEMSLGQRSQPQGRATLVS